MGMDLEGRVEIPSEVGPLVVQVPGQWRGGASVYTNGIEIEHMHANRNYEHDKNMKKYIINFLFRREMNSRDSLATNALDSCS